MKYRTMIADLRVAAGLGLMGPMTLWAATGPAITGVVAPANDAGTAASNPAGLTRLHKSEWLFDLQSYFTESTSKTTADSIDASTTEDTSGSMFIPAAYYARPYNDKITFGLSLSVPAGVGSDPGSSTASRYLLEEWTLGYVSLAPAIGYRLNEQWSLGAAVNFNYAAYDYKTAVYNGPGEADGEMEYSDGDFGMGFQLGVLYELTETTRFGLMYRSSSKTEFSDTPDLSGLTPEREAMLEDGLRTKNIGLESEFPQVVAAGAYHEFANGASATVDVAWIDFSEFGLTTLTLDGTTVQTNATPYDDMWAGSVGYSWPVNPDWTMRVGAAYVSSGVDDQNRTFAFRLDRIIGAGVGAEYRWGTDRLVGINLTYYDLGDGPVENDVPLLGTLSAEYSDNYAIGLDISLRWIPK